MTISLVKMVANQLSEDQRNVFLFLFMFFINQQCRARVERENFQNLMEWIYDHIKSEIIPAHRFKNPKFI